MKIIDYELTCDISYLFEKRIFIYGTGMYGNKVASTFLQMGIKIDGFCETNPNKNEFLGKKIISVEMLIENYDHSDVLVIIASAKYYKEMIYALHVVENMTLCTYYALFISLYLNCESDRIAEVVKNNVKFFKKASIDMAIRNLFGSGMRHHCDILSQPSLIWIYQPGKVASASIYRSSLLKTYHMHTLTLPYEFSSGDDMYDIHKDMLTKIKKNPIKIITGVREPISRDMSLFFQGTDADIWPLIRYNSNEFGDYSKNSQLDIVTLRKRIGVFEKSLEYSFEHLCKVIEEYRTDEFSWFDYEIKALLGIDIYDYPFDKEKGYTIIEQDNIQIFVYKCEKLNHLEKIIREFIDDPGFLLNSTNQGNEKVYSYVYKKFKEEVKLNKEYFDYYYADNQKLKHFYTDAEIKQFKQKWEKKLQ